jgi:hypothetical protein
MSLDRDLQSKQGALEFDTITLIKNGDRIYTQTIDTKALPGGSFRNLFCTIELQAVLGAQQIRVIAQESTDGITWTDASYKLLPSRHAFNNGQWIFDPVAPYIQTVGLMSSHRYVRFGANAVNIIGVIVLWYNVSFETENQDFLDYDPTLPVVPPDALP